MSFAENTSVSVGRTQEEIKRVLTKYDATGFIFGESDGRAMVGFVMKARQIKFYLPLPIKGKTRGGKYNDILGDKNCEQLTRSRWRCLLLAIKAKLECVESEISTFEQEFLAYVVMPNGQTVGSAIIPQIAQSYETGNMPPLLGPGFEQ